MVLSNTRYLPIFTCSTLTLRSGRHHFRTSISTASNPESSTSTSERTDLFPFTVTVFSLLVPRYALTEKSVAYSPNTVDQQIETPGTEDLFSLGSSSRITGWFESSKISALKKPVVPYGGEEGTMLQLPSRTVRLGSPVEYLEMEALSESAIL